jgi:hypothetical protein
MAECIVLKGGGGADLDVVTAGAPDILAGKVAVDKDGEPVTGTMANRGSAYHGVGSGLNTQGLYYYIGPGYYSEGSNNPWVYMTRAEVAATLGIEPWKIRGDVNLCGVQGGIPMQGADVSGTDRARATNMSNWAGTINLGVRNGYYLNGVSWIQQDIPNYQPWNIKKDVNIGGVVGTFEGWVPTANDLYVRGNNIAGWDWLTSTGGSFDTGQITTKSAGGGSIYTKYPVGLTGYNYLNIEGYTSNGSGILKTLRLWNGATDSRLMGFMDLRNYGAGNYTYSFSIAAWQITNNIKIEHEYLPGAIYRIWLS